MVDEERQRPSMRGLSSRGLLRGLLPATRRGDSTRGIGSTDSEAERRTDFSVGTTGMGDGGGDAGRSSVVSAVEGVRNSMESESSSAALPA
jgi:hypothetical protein